MTIETKVLGYPGQDNAVYMRINTGQTVYSLLFDCGDGCLYHLGRAVLQDMDHLFISHCHMDHMCGFDGLFRHLYARQKPFHIWGPAGITRIMHCRFQGFTWNLVDRCPGEITVHEISGERITDTSFYCRDGFRNAHPAGERDNSGIIFENTDFRADCVILDHKIECLAYSVTEQARKNINPGLLDRHGLVPGPWCSELKNSALPPDRMVDTGSGKCRLEELRSMLMEEKGGEKAVYITDIIFSEYNVKKIIPFAVSADHMVIECTYRNSEEALAAENYHLTARHAGAIARATCPGKLTLFHISDRYSRDETAGILKEAREAYPAASFPSHWTFS